MFKNEIFIVSEDTQFLVNLIKFLERQPEQTPPKTTVIFCEEGTKALLDSILEGVDNIDKLRKGRLEQAKELLKG